MKLLTTLEVIALTRLSRTTIYGLVRSGELRHMKSGKKLLFNYEHIIEWLESLERC